MDPPFRVGKTLENGKALCTDPGIEAAFVEKDLNVREAAMRPPAGGNYDAHSLDCPPAFPPCLD